ncbi:hypothetical protein KTH_23160 [Thermosporothrix hazakensis]|jgi:hypothetical protein|uniref:Uncharacterized protein n=1 Tax=Thermosporothrix sp. COM3 TaxID=2490863 RepID=A0A455SVV1_9CHLR|nr:hypothetical protein KTC_40150 [Thermosporothrix sp. COM3]GCE47447.1 hypothetical protein KTH_23160 [Thermosporothrix hazakensis]
MNYFTDEQERSGILLSVRLYTQNDRHPTLLFIPEEIAENNTGDTQGELLSEIAFFFQNTGYLATSSTIEREALTLLWRIPIPSRQRQVSR